MLELQKEVKDLLSEQRPKQNLLLVQLKNELKAIEREIANLAAMLTEVRHRRPLIQRIDGLEDERQALELRLSDATDYEVPAITKLSLEDLRAFAAQWRSNLSSETMDKRKAIFRQLVDNATFDGEELVLVPNYQHIAGVKMASPRGVEPLLPG